MPPRCRRCSSSSCSPCPPCGFSSPAARNRGCDMTTLASDTEVRPGTHRQVTQAAVDRRVKLFNRTCAGVLIAFALLWLVPLAWAVDTSLKPNGETTNPTWKIMEPTLASYRTLLDQGDILNWYAASIITSTLSALGTVVTASLAAYALSRMRFRYRWLVFWFVLIGIMIPN